MPDELKFASEEAKLEALSQLDLDAPDADPDQIAEQSRLIREAPIVEGEQVETPSESVSEVETPPEPKDSITFEQLGFEVPQETYFDRDENRDKKVFTWKDPKSALESIPHAQKHLNYLKHEHIPKVKEEAEKAGYEKAQAEHKKKIEELESKIQELSKTAQPPAKEQEQPQRSSDLDEAIGVVKKFNPESDDYDMLNHLAATQKLVTALATERKNDRAFFEKQIKEIAEKPNQQVQEFITSQEKTRQEQEETKRLEQEAAQRNEKWNKVCQDIDTFAPTIGINTGQSFQAMTKEALDFQNVLGQLYSNKTNPTDEEIMMATAQYNQGVPLIIDRVKNAGYQEPANYKSWQLLDQVDALRDGHVIDPKTGQWRPATNAYGQKVTFPDHKAAYDYYKELTGIKGEEVRQAKVDASQQTARLLNTRDKRVISMDTSKTLDQGDGNAITEKEAQEWIVQNTDIEEMMAEAQMGNPERINTMNKYRERLGYPPLAVA